MDFFCREITNKTKTNLQGICPKLSYKLSESDVCMMDVYEDLPFDDPDGGVWKQGYPITTNDDEWVGKQLKGYFMFGQWLCDNCLAYSKICPGFF